MCLGTLLHQQPQPIHQVPFEEVNFADMAVDQPFGDLHSNPLFNDVPGSFSIVNVGAGNASVSRPVEPISLDDPIHMITEQGGCYPARVWSTSAMMNDYRLPRLSVEQAEQRVALATLKLQLARLEREEELVRARLSAEQATAEVLQTADQERKKLETELGQLRVDLARSQAKVAAAEAVQVAFQEREPQIPDGPLEVRADLSNVLSAAQDAYLASEDFKKAAEDYGLAQAGTLFGKRLEQLLACSTRLDGGEYGRRDCGWQGMG